MAERRNDDGNDDDSLDPSLLAAYTIGDAPHDLADRVLADSRLANLANTPTAATGHRARIGIAFAAAAAVLLGTLGVYRMFGAARSGSGRVVAATRTSVSLASRGVAVLETGADIVWSVAADRRARVDQRAGDVFYRVERGEPFVVTTAAGDVTVKGTCFRVEVRNMRASKEGLAAAAIGAAVTATVLVTVYEGKVLFANEKGRTELAAGERASAATGAAPTKADSATALAGNAPVDAPSADATREELARREEALRGEVVVLRDRLRALNEDLTREKTSAKQDRKENPVDPSKEELLDLVKKCRLQYDVPSIDTQKYSGSLDAELGLTPEERAAIDQAHDAYRQHMTSTMRSIYTEISGDARAAEMLSTRALQEEIISKGASTDELKALFQRLAQERAGLTQPPGDASQTLPVERFYRLVTSAGDSFERDLARIIGPDRAHDARKKHGGFNMKYGTGNGCPESTGGQPPQSPDRWR